MKMMDHDQAIRAHAAERYLLNELNAQEREDFEGHFFACTVCAEEVQTTFAFADNAAAALAEEGQPAAALPRTRPVERERAGFDWFAWLRPNWAPMAAALLLAVTLYQSIIVIPTLRQDLSEATTAQALPTVIARQATRGDDDVIRIAPTDRFVHLVLDVLGPAGSLYVCDIRDEAGNILFRVPATKSSESGSLGLLLPTAALKSGRHEVTVRATDSAESPLSGPGENYTFVLERN